MSLRINDEVRPGISSDHMNAANALFAGGSTRFLPVSTTADRLRSLFTIAGGEPNTASATRNRSGRARNESVGYHGQS
jgi:prepilin-type processing-associated H-X9-DG protein